MDQEDSAVLAVKKLGLLKPYNKMAIFVPTGHPVVLEQDELISTQTSLVVLKTTLQTREAIDTSALQVGPIVGVKT